MLFSEIIGQEVLKRRLIQTVKDQRLSHAWLFFGSEGVGTLPLAVAFAGYILCTNRKDDDACGVCAGCSKTGKYIHPDLHFVFPVNKSGRKDKDNPVSDDFIAEFRSFLTQFPYNRLVQWYDFIDLENKQGIIGTEESKKLAGKLHLKPYESEYKIVIIWQPEKMNDQAANKLLKLLEEPPPMTVFILVSENQENLLPTVRSRCVPIKIPRIDDADILKVIIEKHQVNELKANNIVRLACGNYLKASELITEVEEENLNYVRFRNLMRSCFRSNIPELLKHAEELSALTRENQKSFLECGLGILRESMALHYQTSEIVYIRDEEQEFIPNFAPYISGENIVAMSDELNRAIYEIERNVNSRIVFLDVALKFASMIKK
jgi:DNA polymerase III subunit delta'